MNPQRYSAVETARRAVSTSPHDSLTCNLVAAERLCCTSMVALSLAFTLSVLAMACGSQRTEEAAKAPETSPPAAPAAEAAYAGIDLSNGGSISGVVKFIGGRPKLAPRQVTKFPEICGHGTKPSQEIVFGAGDTLQNVVVSIEGIKTGKKISPLNPVLDQIKCDYVPHVQSVTLGSTLEIRNSDDLLHNVHGKLEGRVTMFNLAMPLKNHKIQKLLTKPGLIALQCDAGHTWMRGFIVVVEHPYHATTDKTGSFSLKDVPPGTCKLKAWHERLGTLEQDVIVSPGSEAKVSFEFKAP